MSFIQEQLLFFLAIALLLFFPGVFVLQLFFKNILTQLESLVISLPLSIGIVNFLIILVGRLGIRITAQSILFSLFCCGAIALLFAFFLRKYRDAKPLKSDAFLAVSFSKRQGLLILSILALTIFIKTLYLSAVILPTATDLGHHMYWAKSIATSGVLPQYVEQDIVEQNGVYQLASPIGIDDFIIGEHLIFAATALISGSAFVGSFPIIILFLVNVFSLLAIFLLALREFTLFEKTATLPKGFAVHTAIATLFLLGPLYALASPQAKFISGGVIGNTFGNLFVPILLWCYLRAIRDKSARFLTLAFFFTFVLAYIHHLTTLVFLFIVFFTLLIFVGLRGALFLTLLFTKTSRVKHKPFSFISSWKRLFLRPAPLLFVLLAILFFFFVLAPSYADPKSLNTALGTPTKATRTGLSFLQLSFSIGEGRLGLGLIGMLILLFLHFSFTRKTIAKPSPKELAQTLATSLFFGWGLALLVMSLHPEWLFLDIPSNRIATYASFPLTLLAGFAFTFLFTTSSSTRVTSIHKITAIILFSFCVIGGFYDNSQSLLQKSKAQEALQTYAVSDYLATRISPTDLLLKDHNYIVADSWMKLSFLSGYTFPLSRGYFKRYEDETKPRERCTLWMIATPNSANGEQCFDQTGTNILIVNPHFDRSQFEKSNRFFSLYQSNDIAVYLRK
jgi:hypothetical protein